MTILRCTYMGPAEAVFCLQGTEQGSKMEMCHPIPLSPLCETQGQGPLLTVTPA